MHAMCLETLKEQLQPVSQTCARACDAHMFRCVMMGCDGMMSSHAHAHAHTHVTHAHAQRVPKRSMLVLVQAI